MSKGLLADTVKYFPAQIVPGVVGLVSMPVVTRLFAPSAYGNHCLATATVMVLTALLTMASGPIAMHIWESRGEHDSRQFATEVARLYLRACVPAVVGLSVLSLLVVRTLGGAACAGGHAIMPCVLLGVLLLGIQQLYQSGFLFHQKTSFITLAIVTVGVLNVSLNILFVPRYGYRTSSIP